MTCKIISNRLPTVSNGLPTVKRDGLGFYDEKDNFNNRLEFAINNFSLVRAKREKGPLLVEIYKLGRSSYVLHIYPTALSQRNDRFNYDTDGDTDMEESDDDMRYEEELRQQPTIDLMFNTRRKVARYLCGFVSKGRGEKHCRQNRMTVREDVLDQLVSHVFSFSVFDETTLSVDMQRLIVDYL